MKLVFSPGDPVLARGRTGVLARKHNDLWWVVRWLEERVGEPNEELVFEGELSQLPKETES